MARLISDEMRVIVVTRNIHSLLTCRHTSSVQKNLTVVEFEFLTTHNVVSSRACWAFTIYFVKCLPQIFAYILLALL